MLLHIPHVLSKAQVADIREQFDHMAWIDGQMTAGAQAAQVKRNMQISTEDPNYSLLADQIVAMLSAHPLVLSAALPQHILSPLFNCYQGHGHYGDHVDGAIHRDPQTGTSHRTDVSLTLFLSEPDEYVGGELVIEDTYGSHRVKLDAGDAILYPSTSVHRVEPVSEGMRLASFTWIQSMVRSDAQRQMLFDLDMTILQLRQQLGDTPQVTQLTHHYHNLLRQWSEL